MSCAGYSGLAMARDFRRPAHHPDPPRDVSSIIALVAGCHGLTAEDLRSRSRSRRRHLVAARHIAIYLCRRHTDTSLATIGEAFERDHSTVKYALGRITQKLERDDAYRERVESILPRYA